MSEGWDRVDRRNLGRIADALEQLVRLARRCAPSLNVTTTSEDVPMNTNEEEEEPNVP